SHGPLPCFGQRAGLLRSPPRARNSVGCRSVSRTRVGGPLVTPYLPILLLAESGLSISPLAVLSLMLGTSLVAGAIALVSTESMGAVVAAALVGFWPPLVWVMWVRNRRIRAMEILMPGALDQLADCLHSGQTLEQAAESVSLQTASPLKEEFGHCVQLLKMGQSPVAVMDRLSRRIPLPEFRLFATAVLVHRQTGGNLAELTGRLAVSARDRQEWRRHLGAQTVAGRYSAI